MSMMRKWEGSEDEGWVAENGGSVEAHVVNSRSGKLPALGPFVAEMNSHSSLSRHMNYA